MRFPRASRVLAIGLFLSAVLSLVGFAAAAELKSGVDRAGFDTRVSQGENFFLHVNGKWIQENPIPAEYSRWGAFMYLADNNLNRLNGLLEDLSKDTTTTDPDKQKLRDLYRTAMDEKQLEEAGAKPLAPYLNRIAKISDKDSLVAELAKLRAEGFSLLFRFDVSQDDKDSTHYAVSFNQGGLSLPEKNYYLGKSDDSMQKREAYKKHVAAMFVQLGDAPDKAAAEAETVLAIETKLAEGSRSPVELRDSEKNYNKKTRAELATLAPNIKPDAYLTTLGAGDVQYVIVGQPEFYTQVNGLLDSIPVADWKTYLRWHMVHDFAPFLSSAFDNENFAFYGKVMQGVEKQQPRWKRVVKAVDGMLGQALGKSYVEKYFPPEAKQRMIELVKNLREAYAERIASRTWMGPETKKQALAKLDAIATKIGYPDKWKDYSALEIKPDSYAANVIRVAAFETREDIEKLKKPLDRTEWHMPPPMVNAYYNPNMNEIVFPAGILQPPFFDPLADDAVNYGGIGAVIGHEISHGFDDQGSHFDAQGNMKNWWTDQDRANYESRTQKLAKQYDECVALEEKKPDGTIEIFNINGNLTLGENIADLGGVTISYAAYQKSLKGKPAPVIDGFTGPQRFFIGFAQVWRGSIRDPELKQRLRIDPHSPGNFRTLVPLSNVAAFYEAFDIKPGDKMYRKPEDRVEVW